MGNQRKRSLPVVPEGGLRGAAAAPTIAAARKRLGGRGASAAGQGRIVVIGGGGEPTPGVVLFVDGATCDVWADGAVRRTPAERIAALGGAVPVELSRIAADVSVFARLAEGERVRYEVRGGEMSEGTLVEKCRYGALVLGRGGVVTAVGFRKLWPIARGEPPS